MTCVAGPDGGSREQGGYRLCGIGCLGVVLAIVSSWCVTDLNKSCTFDDVCLMMALWLCGWVTASTALTLQVSWPGVLRHAKLSAKPSEITETTCSAQFLIRGIDLAP